MASASETRKRRKVRDGLGLQIREFVTEMGSDMVDDTKPALKNLYEALDGEGRSLCLLPLEEIRRQKLFHKTAALLLEDRLGRLLLQADSDTVYDFSFFGPVPAFMGKGEFAAQVAFANWKVEKIFPLWEYPPCPENGQSFGIIFKLPASNALAEMFAQNRQKFLLADSVEIASLIKYGMGLSPFLKLFLEDKGGKARLKSFHE